jgi:SAM-dependent methyltransferase
MKIGDFLDFKFSKNHFDVVTLNNALEHLHDPATTLKAIEKVLKPNGLLLITVPNAQSLGWKIFGSSWYAMQPPRHLYHFTPQTLTSMVEHRGFEGQDINHWYWIHNFYSMFESFRHQYSPRFSRSDQRKKGVTKDAQTNPGPKSLKKEIGKIVFRALAASLALLGSLAGHGEVMCLSAVKKSVK